MLQLEKEKRKWLKLKKNCNLKIKLSNQRKNCKILIENSREAKGYAFLSNKKNNDYIRKEERKNEHQEGEIINIFLCTFLVV